MNELENMIGRNEHIYWKGEPDKKCFILESVFNPLLPFALIWFLFDSFIIKAAAKAPDPGSLVFFAVFFLFHLMPVWIYIGGVIFSVRKHRHTHYIITDKGIYISDGLFAFTSRMKPFAELSSIEIHRGIFDQQLDVGDVVITSAAGFSAPTDTMFKIGSSNNIRSGSLFLKDLNDYQYVYNLIKRLQTDIYADTMYPNDLRPGTNHGYKTEYTPDSRD